MMKSLHVVFAGGGTAGHLFPGLAVAQRLVARIPEMQVTFCGTGKPLEQRQVTDAGFDYLVLPCRPFSLKPGKLVSFAVETLAGTSMATRFLDHEQVTAVVGLGGYASVPMSRAAVRRKLPLVLLEQNVIPGKATRHFSRRANLICAAFAQTRANLRCKTPIRVSGNPIREGFDAETIRQATDEPGRLVVLGGSGGAQSINENIPRALYRLRCELEDWQIVHQSGQRDFELTRNLYAKFGMSAHVVDFVDKMPKLLRRTDLVIGRAGGTTLSELAAAGIPAVLLPYPQAAADHQRANAAAFDSAGAAVLLDERDVIGRVDHAVAETVATLLADPARRTRMSAAMRRLARPNAADDVAEMILEVAGITADDTELRPAA